MAHEHPVIDQDKHFVIDPITRKIKSLTPEKNSLVRYDHNSERFTFEIPRYVDGHDMSLCNVIQIHFINISANKTENNSDVYEVEDMYISDDKKVVFSWLISKNATQFNGTLNFAIRFACSTGETIEYAWHTDIYSGISIVNSINNGAAIVEEYSDILEEWRLTLFGYRVESVGLENPKILRELASGTYHLFGDFLPYAGSTDVISFNDSLHVNVIQEEDKTSIQVLYPKDNCVKFLEITDDSCSSRTVYLDDLSTIEYVDDEITKLDDSVQTKLDYKAPIESPTLTGTPEAPTASAGTNTTQIATTAFVQTAVSNGIAASDALIFKGSLGDGGTITSLPTTYKTGWTYRVVTSDTYAGQVCEVGDLVVALVDRSGSDNDDSDWCVAQTNIDGAVTGIKNGDAYISVSQNDSVVTIAHKDVTRSNTTSTDSPSHGGTFTAVKSVTSDSKGHVTGVDTETVTIPNSLATQSAAGLESADDKKKLDGIATGAEVNQNAFSNIIVGSETISADSKTDVLNIEAGSNVTITPDETDKKLTIASSHPTISVSTDTTSTDSPSAGGTFTAVDSVTRDGDGHVTNVNTKTVTLPNTAVTVDSELSSTSTNPLQNKAVYTALDGKANMSHYHAISDVSGLQSSLSDCFAASQPRTANTVLAAPNGSNGGASFRALVAADLPSHSHSYLPLSGGGMNGNIYYSAKGTSYIGQGPNDAANPFGGALNNLVIASWWGVSFTTACEGIDLYGKNAVSIDCRTGNIFAAQFNGYLSGNASSATKATQDGNGNNIASTYVTKSNPSSSGTLSHNGTATGTDAVALGYGANASGNWSRALSNYSTASGVGSVTLGYHSTASGVWANSLGFFTTALDRQTVIGHHNDTSLADSLGDYVGSNSGTAFVIGNGTDSSHSNAFRVRFDGIVYSKGSYNNSGADYAEYLEWSDGNANNEDRRGYVVTFDEENPGKIRKANSNDYVVGIVSGNPCILGNSDEGWLGQYLRDDFGTILTEEIEEEIETIDPDTDETVIKKQKSISYIVNPDYDPQKVYVHRENRPEWDAIGFLGVLIVRDDNTCVANGYCKVSEGGIMTSSEKGTETYKVIERVTDNLIKVLIK